MAKKVIKRNKSKVKFKRGMTEVEWLEYLRSLRDAEVT